MNRIDPARYATTGREYTATDVDGAEHIIVKTAETFAVRWNTYYISPDGRISPSGHLMTSLRAAREHVAQVGGYAA